MAPGTASSGDDVLVTWTVGNLGNVYKNQGRYDLAVEMYQKAVEIDQRTGDEPGLAADYGNLGTVHLELGNYTQAIEMHQKALEHCI